MNQPIPAPSSSGASYLFKGFRLMLTPGIRRFVLIPLLVNLCFMGGLLSLVLFNLHDWIQGWLSFIPTWFDWLLYVIWPLLAIATLITLSYFFSTFANWIAAPFNGLLAEHLESILTGKRPPDEGILSCIKDLPRVFGREWRKMCYFLPKAIGLLLLTLVPLLGQTLVPLLWFVFTAWMMSIQYNDYSFDNHRVSFDRMKQALRDNQTSSLSFGAMVAIFSMIPMLNLFVMPAAVCGATAIWVDKYRQTYARY